MPEGIEKFTHHTIRQQKKDGSFKTRELMIPSDEVRDEHQKMLNILYSWDIPMPHATGAVPGKTLLDNAKPHRYSSRFYLMDFKDAYQNVDIEALIETVRSPLTPKRYHDMLENFIRSTATSEEVPGLPLGAPCSPFLFNLYCVPMDRELSAFCKGRAIQYTRYLDDLTFSSDRVMGKKLRKKLREIIGRQSSIAINHRKNRVHSIGNGPVTITGIAIQPDGRMQPTPEFFETARDVFEGVDLLRNSDGHLSEEDEGRLHGYHGALHQMTSQETPTVREFDTLYKRALGKGALVSVLKTNT